MGRCAVTPEIGVLYISCFTEWLFDSALGGERRLRYVPQQPQTGARESQYFAATETDRRFDLQSRAGATKATNRDGIESKKENALGHV